jgi:hypothetical protein
MFRVLRYLIVLATTLAIFATTLAPALQTVVTELTSVMSTNEFTSGVVGNTTTVLFVGMPLLFAGGAVVLAFLIAVGIRGSSF